MNFLFKRSAYKPSSTVVHSLLVYAICSILFGLMILINPALLAYLVAFFFISIGAILISIWLRLK
jgi:uncharacterized membrane protein HdeD (DUF308 family)